MCLFPVNKHTTSRFGHPEATAVDFLGDLRRDWCRIACLRRQQCRGGATRCPAIGLMRRPRWMRDPWSAGCCWLLLLTAFTVTAHNDNEKWLADPENVTSGTVTANVTNGSDVLPGEENYGFRSRVASKLQELTRQIRNEESDLRLSILLEMNKIVSQLDPRFALDTESLLVKPQTIQRPIPDTCGEIFNGTLVGYPWNKTGFVESHSCKREKKRSIKNLVTILLLDRHKDVNKTIFVLESIRTYNADIKVILGSRFPVKSLKTSRVIWRNIDTVRSTYKDILRPGKILNLMVLKIQTPYVLIARDIFYLNELARLERQVFVISSTNAVGISGGAFRNETGYWNVGCLLSSIKNFFLKFTEGYKYSALDCMICDHLEGPFVAKMSILKAVPFKENLYEDVVFEDWFLRVKEKNILTMNCPDAMYFKRGPVEGVPYGVKLRQRTAWLGLAREWKVDLIQYPSRISAKFTPRELNITCDLFHYGLRSSLIPPSCLEQFPRAMKALVKFTEERGIDYEIVAGTLLGAVKMSSILPWDIDADVWYFVKDYNTFYQNRNYFDKQGFRFSNFKKNRWFYFNTPDITIDMYAEKENTTYLPKLLWKYPTRMKINGIWVRGKRNPALYVRNLYGPAVLKHVQHWGFFKNKSFYKSGSWIPCTKGVHHGCLDQYPADGSEELLRIPCA